MKADHHVRTSTEPGGKVVTLTVHGFDPRYPSLAAVNAAGVRLSLDEAEALGAHLLGLIRILTEPARDTARVALSGPPRATAAREAPEGPTPATSRETAAEGPEGRARQPRPPRAQRGAIAYGCPTCKAEPDEPCQTSAGNLSPEAHAARWRAARAAKRAASPEPEEEAGERSAAEETAARYADSIGYPCPACHANPHERCTTPGGLVTLPTPHERRQAVARQRGEAPILRSVR